MADWTPPEVSQSWSPPEVNQEAPAWSPPEVQQAKPSWSPPEVEAQDRGGPSWAPDTMLEFGKGLHRGVTGLVEAGKMLPDVGEAFINQHMSSYNGQKPFSEDKIKQDALEYQKNIATSNQEYPAAVPTYHVITTENYGKYLAGQVGEMTPGMAGALIPGGIAGKFAEGAMIDLAAKAGQTLTEDATKAFIQKGVTAASMTGAGAAMTAQQTPALYANWLAQGKDDPGTAILAGAASSALMTVMPGTMLGKVLGPELAGETMAGNLLNKVGVTNNLVNKTLGNLITGGVEQGGAGAAAQVVNLLAEHQIGLNPDLYTKENFAKVVDSGITNAIAGSVMSAGLGHFASDHPSIDPIKEKLDKAAAIGNTGEVKLKEIGRGPSGEQSVAQATDEDVAKAKAIEEQAAVTPEQKAMLNQKEIIQDQKKPQRKRSKPSINDTTVIEPAHLPPELKAGIQEVGGKVEDTAKLTPEEMAYGVQVQNALARGVEIPEAPEGIDPTILSRIKTIDQDRLEAAYGAMRRPSALSPKELETLKITDPELADKLTAKTQPTIQLPFKGDLYQDLQIPHMIGQHLDAFTLRDVGQHQAALDSIKRISRELFGTTNTSFWDSIHDNLNDNPVAGAQYLNGIHVALNDSRSYADQHETAYHEGWHLMVRAKVISDAERALFDHKLLKDYMAKDGYLRNQDYDQFLQGPEGREELEANAFGKMMKEMHLGGQTSAPGMFRSAFMKARNWFRKVGFALKGQDINTIHDLLQHVSEGGRAEAVKSSFENWKVAQRGLDSMNHTLGTARLQPLMKELYENEMKEAVREHDINMATLGSSPSNRGYMQEAIKSATNIQNVKFEQMGRKQQSWFASVLNTPAMTSVKNPFASMVQNHLLNKMNTSAGYMSTLHEPLKIWKDAEPELANAVANRMAKARIDGQKGVVTMKGAKLPDGTEIPEGSIGFANHGKGAFTSALTDPEQVKVYKSLQDAMSKRLDLTEQAFKKLSREQFMDLLPEDYKLGHVQEALRNMREDNPRFEKLRTLAENLQDAQAMRLTDYVPFQRYGTYGITVQSRTEKNEETGKQKQVAMYQIEAGHGGKGLNQYQLKQHLAEIKAKYSDPKLFRVVGAEGIDKPITNFDNHEAIRPFALTYNNIHSMIDPRFMNIEMYASLAHGSSVDPEALRAVVEQIKDTITGDMAHRSFGKAFRPSENLQGYSKDWNRVLHTSTSGLSHMMANMDSVQSRAALERALPEIQDKGLRDQMSSLLQYAGSPNEDMQGLRSLNYIYAMGGNLSSAMVQLSTLITRVMPEMFKYSPNMLYNMHVIGKNLAKAGEFYVKAGLTSTQAAREGMVKSGRWSVEQANVHRRAEMENVLQSADLQDAMRTGRYDTNEKMGAFKQKYSSVVGALAWPVAKAEQLLRSATMMSMHEIAQRPEVEASMKKVIGSDWNIKTKMALRPDLSFGEQMGRYTLGLAHGEYGKEGRAAIYRGAGGIVLPFQNFVHNTCERLIHDFAGSKEEKRSAVACIGAMVMMGGLAGVPGVSALEKLYDQYQKTFGGDHETDSQRMIYEKIANLIGNDRVAKALMYGIPRAYGNVAASQRLGVGSLPGQDLIFGAFSAAGASPVSAYGVEGSKIADVQRGIQAYRSGLGPNTLIAAALPSGLANPVKAIQQMYHGILTNGVPPTQIIRPEDMTPTDLIMRAIGVESGHVANLKQLYYDQQNLAKGKAYDQDFKFFESRIAVAQAEAARAQAKGDREGFLENQRKEQAIRTEAFTFAHEHGVIAPPSVITKSFQKGVQMTTGRQPVKIAPENIKESQRLKQLYEGN